MFCSGCGNEIAADVAFCPNCGTKVVTEGEAKASDIKTTDIVSSFTDVKITGKRAGEVPLWYAIVAVVLFLFADILSDGGSFMISTGIWTVCLFIVVYARMLLPKIISYDNVHKKFITNRESRFNVVQKSIDINAVTGVRLRKVKLLFSSRHAFSVPGEYFVFAFDTKYKDTNRYLWFQKEDEFRKFETLAKNVFEENGIDISFDENLELIKSKEFYAQETREKMPFDFSEFLRKKGKTIAIAVGIFLAFGFIVNISESDYSDRYSSTSSFSTSKGKKSVDKALDKMEAALKRIAELQRKSDDDKITYGQFMSEYAKAMKELEDAQKMVEGIDESDVTPEQWDRILKLTISPYL